MPEWDTELTSNFCRDDVQTLICNPRPAWLGGGAHSVCPAHTSVATQMNKLLVGGWLGSRYACTTTKPSASTNRKSVVAGRVVPRIRILGFRDCIPFVLLARGQGLGRVEFFRGTTRGWWCSYRRWYPPHRTTASVNMSPQTLQAGEI